MEKEAFSFRTSNKLNGKLGKSMAFHGSIVLIMSLIISTIVFFQFYSFSEIPSKEANPSLQYQTRDDAVTSMSSEPGSQAEIVADALLAQAQKEDIAISDDQIEEIIAEGLEVYSMSRDELELQLETHGVTYEEYKDVIKTKLMVAEVVNKNIDLQSIKVSDTEVENYILENEDIFSEIIGDADAEIALKQMVRTKLLRAKQEEVVMDYVNSLE